jgi:hypothetical protein
MNRLNDIAQLTLARGEVLMRYLNAKNQDERGSAKRELARFDTEMQRFQKVSGPSHHVPLGGMNAGDILR